MSAEGMATSHAPIVASQTGAQQLEVVTRTS